MSRSLRIKEDTYNKMFFDKCQALELTNKNQAMVRQAQLTMTEAEVKLKESDVKLFSANDCGDFYKLEADRLRKKNEKFQDNLEKETENNMKMYKRWHDTCKIVW